MIEESGATVGPNRSVILRRTQWAVGGLLVAAALWFAVTALLAQAELSKVKAELPRIRAAATAADVSMAQAEARSVARHARRARFYTSGPVWSTLAQVPYFGRPIGSARGLTRAADQLGTDVVPSLVAVANRVEPSKLRLPGDRFDLSAIAAVEPTVTAMANRTEAVELSVRRLPSSTWLGTVDGARRSLDASLLSLARTLHGLDSAVQIAPSMLGSQGPRRYFVGLENEAESRGLGGIPGSFAIVTANQGAVKFEHFGSDGELENLRVDVDLGPAYAQRYGYEDPTGQYIWSDVSPNLPYAGAIWAAMWQKRSGESIDGAIAIDPTALSYLLAVTGPVKATDGVEISAANVVSLTQSDLYARFPTFDEVPQRHAYLVGISQAVVTPIIHSSKTAAMLSQLGVAAGQRRLLMWSADPSIENVLAKTVMGGVIPETSAPYVAPIVTSKSGNKLDYYLDRSFSVARSACGATVGVTVAMRLTNTAPGQGLSPYVTLRTDQPTYPTQPGDQRVNANYFATAGAKLNSATLDGKPATVVTGAERGHPTFQVDVEIPHGASRTVVFTLTEPNAQETPIILRQPLVRPLDLTVTTTQCHGP